MVYIIFILKNPISILWSWKKKSCLETFFTSIKNSFFFSSKVKEEKTRDLLKIVLDGVTTKMNCLR
jgi:hypothetical protein